MAQHGYLREGYGMWGDHDDDFDRSRERGSRSRGDDRGFMFGERERFRPGDEDEWFGGRRGGEHRMSRYGPEHGFGGFQGDFTGGREQGGFGGAGDYARGRTSFTSHPDDHYRSWRQRQIEALDRDYADYCRDREQRFHQDFETWRGKRRQGNRQDSDSGAMELTNPIASGELQSAPDPTATATLGTDNSENSRAGRARR